MAFLFQLSKEGEAERMNKEQKIQTEYLTARQAGEFIGLAPQTLANKRFKGLPPPYSKIGKAIRYSMSDLIKFMESCKVLPRE